MRTLGALLLLSLALACARASASGPCPSIEMPYTISCGGGRLSESERGQVYEALARIHCALTAFLIDDYRDWPVNEFLLCIISAEEAPLPLRVNAATWLGELQDESVIEPLVQLLSQPWPEVQDNDVYLNLWRAIDVIGTVGGATPYDALLPMTESAFWEPIVGSEGVSNPDDSKASIILRLRDKAFHALALTGDPRAVELFSGVSPFPDDPVWVLQWEYNRKIAEIAPRGEILRHDGNDFVPRKKSALVREMKRAEALRVDMADLLPAPPYRPDEPAIDLDSFVPLPEYLRIDLPADQSDRLIGLELGHGADGKSVLETCRSLAADATLPEDARRYAFLRQITYLTYASREGEALEVGSQWLRGHPRDPEAWKIRLVLAHIVSTRGHDGFKADFDLVKEYCDQLFLSEEPLWSMIQAHLTAEYRFAHVVGWPSEEAVFDERLKHVQRAQYLAYKKLTAPDLEKAAAEYIEKKIKEEIDPRVETVIAEMQQHAKRVGSVPR